MLILGSIAFALFVSLIADYLPRWLAWLVAVGFAYGLIFWT